MYEGYGPGGVAIMIEILTDNRNRTAPEIKGIFDKYGGNLAGPGSVSYIFLTRGQLFVSKSVAGEEKLMDVVLDAGAQDVIDEGEVWQVLCEPTDLRTVREALDKAGLKYESAEITRVPTNTVSLTGENARKVLALVEALEDQDDVQKVHANFEVPDAELEAASK
jgi:YebC/PmpR family DNA-binding regulatory protein